MFSSNVIGVVIPAIVWLAGLCHVTRAADCIVDNFAVQANFNITAYAGLWYELNYLPPYYQAMFQPWENYIERYTLDNSTGTPKLGFTYAGMDLGNNLVCMSGTNNPLQASNLANPAKMYFVKPLNSTYTINMDHWVIGTDYVTYAVIYSCPMLNSSGTCQEPAAWVHSRARAITDTAVLGTINSLLASVCLNVNNMYTIWQNDTLCPEVTVTSTATAQPTVTTTAKGAGSQLMTSPLCLLLSAAPLLLLLLLAHINMAL